MRAWLALGTVIVASACGGTPPSAPSAPASVVLPAGEYVVTMSGTGAGGLCFGLSVSGERPDTVTFVGAVTGDGATFTLRPVGAADRGLVVSLRAVGANTIAGPAAGQVRDDAADITATVAPSAPGLGNGAPATEAVFYGTNVGASDPRAFSGTMTGSISWSGQGGSTTCTAGTWALRPK